MSQEGIFAIKLSELERQYERTLGRLRLCQTDDHQKIRQELKQAFEEYHDTERQLLKEVNTSRSLAVAALSGAQLNYDRRVREILRNELPGYLHERGGNFTADQVETISLYGEYAIDFAAQAMRYAHLVVLSSMDAQISLEEQKQEGLV